MRILITGVSTRAIAESASAAGYSFITLDYFGDYDQKRWCENYSLKRDFGLAFGPAELYKASRSLSFDAVVYTANLENYPEVVAKLAAGGREGMGGRLLGNIPAVLTRVRHWPTIFDFLRRQGIPTPETIYPGQQPSPLARCSGRGAGGEGRWLRKPIRSGGGHHIGFWPPDRPPGEGFFLQEYIPGTACSASFVANGRGCVVLGLTEQLIGRAEFGARGFHYCGNILPLTPGPSPRVGEGGREGLLFQVRQIVDSLTQEFGLVGVNGLDFVLNNGQAVPVEVNPRYSASMELIERAYGLSIFDLHVRAITRGELPEFDPALSSPIRGEGPASQHFYGKAILYAERDGRAPDTQDWPERGIRDVPFPDERLTQGGPICTVLANGPTRDACLAGLVAQAEALKGEIYA